MVTIVKEKDEDKEASDDAVGSAALPFLDRTEGLEALNHVDVIKKPWKYPETGSKQGNKQVENVANYDECG